MSGFDRQVNAKGGTVADVVMDELGRIADAIEDLAGPLTPTAKEAYEAELKKRGWLDPYEAETAAAMSYGEGQHNPMVGVEAAGLRAAVERLLDRMAPGGALYGQNGGYLAERVSETLRTALELPPQPRQPAKPSTGVPET